MNILIREETETVWVPSVIFDNTDNKAKSKNDEETIIKVSKLKNGTFNDDGLLSEDIDIYEGMENQLLMSRVYNKRFICEYDMSWYPFDTQTCHMDFKLEENMNNFLQLVTGSQKYLGPRELTQYFVKSCNITYYESRQAKGVRISVTLGRRLLGTFLTVYFPTILLNVINHCTNFFKDFFFEAVVTVNLTSMLVLVTMFISVSNNLPKTSYIKMMDIWLIFNLLFPFLEVLVHTYMDHLRDDENRDINHHGSTIRLLHKEIDNTVVIGNNQITPVINSSREGRPDEENFGHGDTEVSVVDKDYGNIEHEKTKSNERKIGLVKICLLIFNTFGALSFVSVYWFVGLRHAEYI